MKIKLDFEKKEIELVEKVGVKELVKKIEELGLDINDWSFVVKIEHSISDNLNQSPITSYPSLIPHSSPITPNKIWY